MALKQDDLGMRLRRSREHARLSQTAAARSLGLSPAALNQYEAGKRRVDALTLDRLGRLYGVPLRSFFGQDEERSDWEEALRHVADDLSPAGKRGIGRLVSSVRDMEELYDRTGTPRPGRPHPPFEPLPKERVSVDEVAVWAEKARRHFDLGVAPVPDLAGFLESQRYLIFAVPLGRDDAEIAGLFFLHAALGPIIVVNEDQPFTRRPYALAHELAHGLYHYDRPAVLCRGNDRRPLEDFADRFASFFLIPREALLTRLHDRSWRTAKQPEQIVHLARYFGVSYNVMHRRLTEERRLDASLLTMPVQPVALARTLGYRTSPFELGAGPLPPEDRLPRVFIEFAYRAARDGAISTRRAAEMLGISDLELEERFESLTMTNTAEEARAWA